MRIVRLFAAAVAVASSLYLVEPLPARAAVVSVTDTTPATSLNNKTCTTSITFTATVYGDPGTSFVWLADWTMGGAQGNSALMGPVTIDSSGQAQLTYTLATTAGGHLQFNTQTTVNPTNFNSAGVNFSTGLCAHLVPGATTFLGDIALASVTAAPESGYCAGFLRLGGIIQNNYRAPTAVTYHWLFAGTTSPQQTVTIAPAGRATVGLAVIPFPHLSGTVQLVTDSPEQLSSNPVDFAVSAPPHDSPFSRPLDPGQPPSHPTPKPQPTIPPVKDCS